MRGMLTGIFIMLLSIWSFIFGYADNATVFLFASLALFVIAIFAFIIGFVNDKGQKNGYSSRHTKGKIESFD